MVASVLIVLLVLYMLVGVALCVRSRLAVQVAYEVAILATNTSVPARKMRAYHAQLEVTVDRDTAWLSLDQMAALFDRDKSVISRHIRNVFKEGELERGSVVAKNATTALRRTNAFEESPIQFRLRNLDEPLRKIN